MHSSKVPRWTEGETGPQHHPTTTIRAFPHIHPTFHLSKVSVAKKLSPCLMSPKHIAPVKDLGELNKLHMFMFGTKEFFFFSCMPLKQPVGM